VSIRDERPLLAIDIDRLRLNPVRALPHGHAAFVTDGAVAIARIHLARRGLQGLIAGEHLRVLLRVLLREPARRDFALGGEIAGTLVEADVIGGGSAGGIAHARAGIQHDHVLIAIQRGLGGARLAIAFFVHEVAGLLHGAHMIRARIETRLDGAARGSADSAIALLLLGGGLGGGARIVGVEAVDAIPWSVRDHEIFAIERAVMLRGDVGDELELARRLRDQAFDLATAGTHLRF